jgi:hypothetical protein
MAFPIKIGATSARVVFAERTWDPATGPSTRLTYEGSEDELNALAAAFMLAHNRAQVLPFNGPVYRMVVSFGDAQDGGAETPLDKWDIDTEWAELPIWSNPKVIQSAGSDDALHTWRIDIEAALANTTLPSKTGFVDDKLALYIEVTRGTRAHESKRPILNRVRTISANYAGQIVIEAVESVYTTAKLLTTFAIPTAIANRLPADPAFVPSGRAWAWKERRETSEFIFALNKVEEVKDWIFAPWSTLLFNIVS